MNTFQKYAVLPREVQQEAVDTFNRLQDMGECRPDEWEHIVDYYYDREHRPPDGWFRWWED